MGFKFPEMRATVPVKKHPRTIAKARAYIAELEQACHALAVERNEFATFAGPTLKLVQEIVEYTDEAIGDAIFDHETDVHAHKD